MILLLLITVGCKTTKVEKEITLPPKPIRIEHKNVTSLQDAAEVIKYYEFLLQEWENWGNTVEKTINQN